VELSPTEADTVTKDLIAGQVCTKQLTNTQAAYQVCIDDHHPDLSWWQRPGTIVAGGVTFTFLGFLFGLTRCFGACK
jgi:hypothetical protein